jgi:hypothetical protein
MRLSFLFFSLAACALAQQDQLCDRVPVDTMLTAREIRTPLAILDQVLQESGLDQSRFRLVAISGASPVSNNAAAQVCTEPRCNCIFYDPQFIGTAPQGRAEDWNSVFVLAHETGHHINQHLLRGSPAFDLPRPRKEAQADEWAGWALERLHAPVDAVMAAVDYIASSETDTENYYGRCHRRMDALRGYNRGAAQDGKAQYQTCLSCYPALSQGLYLTQNGRAGSTVTANMVAFCGSTPASDQPTDFAAHLRGACLVSTASRGTLLTWQNTGLCR